MWRWFHASPACFAFSLREFALLTEGRNFGEQGGEAHAGVSVEVRGGALACVHAIEVRLTDHGSDFHLRRVDHLHERNARLNGITLLHRTHAAAQPDGVENRHAVHGSADGHFLGIGLRLAHGLLCAVALNLQNAHGGGGCGSLQIVGFLDLGECDVRFFQGFLIFLGVDARDDFVALHFQLGFFQSILRLGERSIVFYLGNFPFSFFLLHLADEIGVSFLFVEEVLHLGLRVKLHQDFILLDGGAGRDKRSDIQVVELRAFQLGRADDE
jgi:hypothetical protein